MTGAQKFPVAVAQVSSTDYHADSSPSSGSSVRTALSAVPIKEQVDSEGLADVMYVDQDVASEALPRNIILDGEACDLSTVSFDQSINDTDRAAIEALGEYMTANHPKVTLTDATIGPGGDYKLTRFLRSTNHKIPETAARLIDLIEWRRTWRIDELRFAQVDLSLANEHFHYGNRPIHGYWTMTVDSEIKMPVYETGFDGVMASVYQWEAFDRLHPADLDRVALVVDTSWATAIPHISHGTLMMGDVINRHFPGRYSMCVVVNPTPLLTLGYNLIRSFERSRGPKRMFVVEKDVSALQRIFPADVLPTFVGGTMTESYLPTIHRKFKECEESMPPAPDTLTGPRQLFARMQAPASATNILDTVKAGPAHNRVGRDRWMKLFLVLTPQELIIFDKSESIVPMRAINLTWVEIYPNGGREARKWTITVATIERDFFFAFDSAEEHAAWLAAIMEVVGTHEQQDTF